jgi:hypothetical protein
LIHSRKVFPLFWPFLFGFALDQLAFGLAPSKTRENKSKVPTQEGSFHTSRQEYKFFFLKLKGQTLNTYKKFILALALAFPLMKRQKETRLGLAYVKFDLVPHLEECSSGVIKIE